jgi:hypothetical protein
MIKMTEKEGYSKAMVNVGGGRYGALWEFMSLSSS